ncbi:thermonuclease family protein [Candidatus Daviesbacteria bacterium]|nr:thermonuclease family protein [Candidatus Daviesbacteria bacterium]
MWSNTKLLVSASIFIIITGLGFLWFGLKQPKTVQPVQVPPPTLINESSPVATDSARLPSHSSGVESNSTNRVRLGGNVFGIEGDKILVSKVVDGDTIELANGQTVRLIGIDTPETVDPRRPVGCFGKEASNEAKSLLSGKEIILQKDVSETDKYKRLLRYVFLPLENGQVLFVNDYLVREGFAKVLTYPPDVKFNEQFRQAEKEARENRRGLWGRCN